LRRQADDRRRKIEMAEPEDLIIDGAYIASRLARNAWRRYAPPPPEKILRLADVRGRIELFLNALFEAPIAVATANPPAPVSWLGRLAGRAPHPCADALPGTDGVRIYLPPVIAAPGDRDDAVGAYLLLAVEQASRLTRGSTTMMRGIEDDEIRDRFLLADAVAVDRWIVREVAGLVPWLRAARQDALEQRSGMNQRCARERALETRIREVLALDPLAPYDALPVCATAGEARAWAAAVPCTDRTGPAYHGISPAWYWGRPVASAGAIRPAALHEKQGVAHRVATRRRVAEMRRRPRIREAEEDEDDSRTGTWVIRTDEPQESVEDPFGLQRPADRADEADPEALGDSLAELPEARVVRTPGAAREVLRAGDDVMPRTARRADPTPIRTGIAYPEWDFHSGTYRTPGAIVRETAPALGAEDWAASALARHASLVRRVRTRFERLRPRRTRIGRQADGPDVDIAEFVNAAADARAGGMVEDRLYVDVRPARRELTVALLVDVSASTDSWVSGHQRILDVEKDALLVVCEALAALGDPHAIFAFSGESAEHVSVVPLKRFTEVTDAAVGRRIAALEADGYTRIGAAVRHTTAALSVRPTERRLLLLLSDGKPNDVDAYEGPYGVEDARQAIAEARAQNVKVFCLTVDREAPRYATRIFGRAGFTVLRRADQLPEVLIEVLRRLVRRST
jgi:nitric oxide reductase NorD protein